VIGTLDPSVCVSLTSHIHGEKFFNRKVYVTSVVQKTPEKETETEGTENEEAELCPNDLVETSGSDTSSESDGKQSSTVSKPPCTKLVSNISAPGKRSAKGSPEASSEKK
jgi:hypothetical protein